MKDRLIDRLIANKVMGIVIIEIQSMVDGKYYPMIPVESGGVDHLPNYSTDISQAWLVAENFDDIRIERNKELSPKVRVDIWNPNKVSEFADTVPKAICLAALKAVDIKKEEYK